MGRILNHKDIREEKQRCKKTVPNQHHFHVFLVGFTPQALNSPHMFPFQLASSLEQNTEINSLWKIFKWILSSQNEQEGMKTEEVYERLYYYNFFPGPEHTINLFWKCLFLSSELSQYKHWFGGIKKILLFFAFPFHLKGWNYLLNCVLTTFHCASPWIPILWYKEELYAPSPENCHKKKQAIKRIGIS